MAMDGRVVGIAAYLDRTPRAALPCRIKQQATDFIVQEITLGGHVLELREGDAQRLPTQAERDAVITSMEQARQNSAKQRSKERLVLDEPAHGWREELRRLLSAERIAQIERVVAGGEEDGADETFALLEAPIEFRDRVFLQVCIQHCYPSVDCRMRKSTASAEPTDQSTGDDGTTEMSAEAHEIEVVQDGLYKKFRKNGVSDANACKLLTFVRKGAADPSASQGIELVHEDTKDARTSLHRQISSATSLLKTRTDTRDAVQRIVVFFSPQNSKKRKRGDTPPVPLVKFVLRKTNMEHFTCFERIARRLKRPVSAFAYAGTKDKVAVTYQHVTVQGVSPHQVLALNQDDTEDSSTTTSSSGVRIGHVEYVASPMALGNLTGNRFSITVRGLPADVSKDDLCDRIGHVKRHGFINYFGFQRVGLPSSAVRPHQIGELIIAEKWEQAVKTLFTPSAHDPPECAAAKSAFLAKSDDVDAVLKLIPQNSMQTERAVLTGLKRFGVTSWEMAIRNIPFARRIMYLHAYQSFVFNSLASHRIEHFGMQVVAGDLVRGGSDGAVEIATAEKAAQLNTENENPLVCVVLPLPGSNVLYPSNSTGDYAKKLLIDHGTSGVLETSTQLKGAYRALVERPRDVEWKKPEDGDAAAVAIHFSLSSGCFATMCLREILRFDL